MKKYFLVVLAHLGLVAAMANVEARTVGDVYLVEKIPAEDDRPELTLNGAAMRHLYLQVESHVCSLYLENPSTSPTQILADRGYKRMVFHILMKKVTPRRLSDIFREALAINFENKELEKLAADMKEFKKIHNVTMKTGDELQFDYMPNKGTVITYNGEEKGVISGDDLFHGLLTSWIGDKPVNREFKKQILGVKNGESSDTQLSSTN